MTETEWLAMCDPNRMLEFLWGKASDRKLRLFAGACCRRVWDLMHDDRCRQAVEASEQFADGLLTETALDRLSAAAEEAFEDACADGNEDSDTAYLAHMASYASSPSLSEGVLLEAVQAAVEVAPQSRTQERAAQVALISDIFGNPFRPVTIDPSWRSSTVVSLAGQMYESRDFSVMPILADALQDAGCDNPDILDHCRRSGPHVRGCWVVDLMLDRSQPPPLPPALA